METFQEPRKERPTIIKSSAPSSTLLQFQSTQKVKCTWKIRCAIIEILKEKNVVGLLLISITKYTEMGNASEEQNRACI